MTIARLFAALLLLGGFVSAHAETFGRTTVGATASGALRADFKRGSKFTLTQDGTAKSLCAWLDGGGGNTSWQSVRFAMYRDVNGTPGAKLAETSDVNVYAGATPQWICLDIGWTPLVAGNYWLVIHSGASSSNTGPARYFYDGAANYFANGDAYFDGAADPAGAGTGGSGTVSIYASYTPGLQHAGRLTVGTQPSGELRGDFKRGSSFTISQPGRLDALSAYLDGQTGTGPAASQDVRLALYKDVNGTPGPLVTESVSRTLGRFLLPRWFTFPTSGATVQAGKYWLMIHTSPSYTGYGMLRYYADGTGNWLGNADLFNDGAANPFGTAGTGNGTISAYASYEPGTAPSVLGFAAPGAFVKTEGSCNQASQFRLVPSGATLDALYAYLDGRGSGTGTQQARMALYYDSAGYPSGVAATSSVVTIASGQQPGWVKFPMPPTALPAGYYWISLHTGPSDTGTTGLVIRAYQENVGRLFYNCEDAFADGPNAGFVNSDGELLGGDITLSVYATYTAH
jgi:hypothetical protein